MPHHVYGTAMTDGEVEEFLHRQETGVLSLANQGKAYGIPVSYGYDAPKDRCILDLGFAPKSKKRAWLKTTETSSLTVYSLESATDWSSAVLNGSMQVLDEPGSNYQEVFFEEAAEISMAVFDHVPEEVELEWYAFDIESMSGRASNTPK